MSHPVEILHARSLRGFRGLLKTGVFNQDLVLKLSHRTYAETGFINEISWFEQQYHGNKPGFLVLMCVSPDHINLDDKKSEFHV